MDDFACPRCKTTKYRNPSLKLMVNVCGHALCENCIDMLFVKGSAACPECHTALRRGNFRLQLFEDTLVQKEVDIRKKVLKDYNKREEDFATLREYDDYLEEIEDIVYNLTNNIDVENTRRKMEQYKKDNKASIIRNQSKISKEEQYLEALIDSEVHEGAMKRQMIRKEEIDEKRLKTRQKEALVDELMFSDAPVGEILATHAAIKQKTEQHQQRMQTAANTRPSQHTQFSSGIKLWQKDTFLPLPKEEEAPLYRYKEQTRDLWGPRPPLYDELEIRGYLKQEKKRSSIAANSEQEKAGGFVNNIACYRALEEAMCGLFCGTSPVIGGSQTMET